MKSLSDPQERRADALPLRRWKHVQLVDPSFTKRNDAGEFIAVEIAQSWQVVNIRSLKKPAVLCWCMKSSKRGQSMVEGTAMNRCGLIHVCKSELPQHPIVHEPTACAR
jgi:hypothetical protein